MSSKASGRVVGLLVGVVFLAVVVPIVVATVRVHGRTGAAAAYRRDEKLGLIGPPSATPGPLTAATLPRALLTTTPEGLGSARAVPVSGPVFCGVAPAGDPVAARAVVLTDAAATAQETARLFGSTTAASAYAASAVAGLRCGHDVSAGRARTLSAPAQVGGSTVVQVVTYAGSTPTGAPVSEGSVAIARLDDSVVTVVATVPVEGGGDADASTVMLRALAQLKAAGG